MTTPVLPFVRDRRWLFDFALAAVVYLISIAAASPDGYGAKALAALLALALLVRRSLPRLALAWATVAGLAQVVYVEAPTFSIVVVPMIVYASTRYSTPRVGMVALWLGLVGAVLGPARWTPPTSANVVAFAVTGTACAATVTGAYLLGRQLREQQVAAGSELDPRPSASGCRKPSRNSEPARPPSTNGAGSPASCTTSWRTPCR